MKIINTEEERLMEKICSVVRNSFKKFIWESLNQEDTEKALEVILEPELPKGCKNGQEC
jgi:hypothetical protein